METDTVYYTALKSQPLIKGLLNDNSVSCGVASFIVALEAKLAPDCVLLHVR